MPLLFIKGVIKMKYIFLALFTIISMPTFAGTLQTGNLVISQISAWSDNGTIAVQTEPRHSMQGLNCTNDYWLFMEADAVGYDAIVALLINAQATQIPVIVEANDEIGGDFCRLSRLTLQKD